MSMVTVAVCLYVYMLLCQNLLSISMSIHASLYYESLCHYCKLVKLIFIFSTSMLIIAACLYVYVLFCQNLLLICMSIQASPYYESLCYYCKLIAKLRCKFAMSTVIITVCLYVCTSICYFIKTCYQYISKMTNIFSLSVTTSMYSLLLPLSRLTYDSLNYETIDHCCTIDLSFQLCYAALETYPCVEFCNYARFNLVVCNFISL